MTAIDNNVLQATFQSTPSVGRATYRVLLRVFGHCISIHALRGEGDGLHPTQKPVALFISIHALRGEGDDDLFRHAVGDHVISIHALRGEGDDSRLVFLFKLFDFNPRPPWGGRHPRLCFDIFNCLISIHALRGEGDAVEFVTT